MKKGKGIALLPIGVFLVLYLGLGILFEYVMEIPMGFYNVPIVVAFLAAILVACLQNRALDFDKKLEIMAQGVGDKNIITMLLIFLAAGSFVGVVGRSSAESVAYCMLSLIPARFSVSVLFIVACFVSVAMGTSVGTITLLTPIAAAVSTASGFDLAFCVASVMGGAMFGDNLSFISDTTIVATRTQGCNMNDKFKVNIRIALPIAILTGLLYVLIGSGVGSGYETGPIEWIKVLPYLVVLVTAICGVNVMMVLIAGIILSGIVGLLTGGFDIWGWNASMGLGITNMGELIIVTLLAGGMLEMIRYNGGIDWIILKLTSRIRSTKGAEGSIAALISFANLCTANNTIALIMAGPIAKDIADRFKIDPRRSASLLDIFSCFVQGIIPYGAQLLMAAGLGHVSPIEIMQYLYYPYLLGVGALLAITFNYPRKYAGDC